MVRFTPELSRWDPETFVRRVLVVNGSTVEPIDDMRVVTNKSMRFTGPLTAGMPLFAAANRMNAYNTYLLMEHEAP